MTASVGALIDNLCRSLGKPGQFIGPHPDERPRFALFHAANSICSQKVRVVLAHHQIGYTSHPLNLFGGETYLPDYVRLRMIGCEHAHLPLVVTHTGSTAAASTGCDPAVVPTFANLHTGEVVVDSKRICFYVDGLVADNRRLRPPALQDAIDAELEIVDGLPNYQLLAGRPAGTDRRPAGLRAIDGVDFAMSKVRRCEKFLGEFPDDVSLVKAYSAKRAKELDAAGKLFSTEAMRLAYASIESACAQLNDSLQSDHRPWLIGNTVTMADLFWAVELMRIKNLGASHFWAFDKLPAVQRFVAEVERLSSIQSAVLTWPGAQF